MDLCLLGTKIVSKHLINWKVKPLHISKMKAVISIVALALAVTSPSICAQVEV